MMKDNADFACVCASVSMLGDLAGMREALPGGYFLEPPWDDRDLASWEREMGTWQLREIQKANLWVWRTGERGSVPRESATNFWSGLLLTRPPRIHCAWLLTGTLKGGAPQIGGLQRLAEVFVKEPPFPLNRDTLHEAARAGIDIGQCFASGRLRGRLERGLSALLLAMQMEYFDESILALERALEGVFHPTNREQFVKRAKSVLRRTPPGDYDNDALLDDIYNVRSGFTHAETFETVFPGLSKKLATRRARQLQSLLYFFASRSYRAILRDPKLIDKFGLEGLGNYWGKIVAGKRKAPFFVEIAEDEWNFEQTENYYVLNRKGRKLAGRV